MRRTMDALVNQFRNNCSVMEKVIKPIMLDCSNLRNTRQATNNMLVHEAIQSNNMSKFDKLINEKELQRVLEELDNISKTELIDMCMSNKVLSKVLSGRISKKASRQGTKDEMTQIDVCNSTASKVGVHIENLSVFAYRPTKNGDIIELKKTASDDTYNTTHKDECLKSFDAKISGKVNGWVIAKITYGSGGHQDNVMEELDSYCKWVKTYRPVQTDKEKELFVILWDTDLRKQFDTLKNKYIDCPNILITDHYEFQNYILQTYGYCSVDSK